MQPYGDADCDSDGDVDCDGDGDGDVFSFFLQSANMM